MLNGRQYSSIVSVPPIAVADAAPVYSRIILYEVNSLYSVTLYCCEPSFMLYIIERTAYRGDIFESDKSDRCKQTAGPLNAASFAFIYGLVSCFILYEQFGRDIAVCDCVFVRFLHCKANVLFTMLASCMD